MADETGWMGHSGTPEGGAAFSFWQHVERSGSATGCWEWLGATLGAGYGKFHIGRKRVSAHRFAWQIANGPIPLGLNICHSCDNRRCVNPHHLFVATQSSNLEDMRNKGRAARGVMHGFAKLKERDVIDIRHRRRAGESRATIAHDYGITPQTVSNVVTRTWRHVEGGL